MTIDQVLMLGRESLIVALTVAAPCLALSIGAGLLVSIFQATTQIHDQTLSFVPKILAVAAGLLLFGGWMLRTVVAFTTRIIEGLPGLT